MQPDALQASLQGGCFQRRPQASTSHCSHRRRQQLGLSRFHERHTCLAPKEVVGHFALEAPRSTPGAGCSSTPGAGCIPTSRRPPALSATHLPAPQSYHRFMHEHLFSHVDIPAEAVHIPNGMVPLADVPKCALCCRMHGTAGVQHNGCTATQMCTQSLAMASMRCFVGVLHITIAAATPSPCSHCQEYERQIREAGGIDLQASLGMEGPRIDEPARPCVWHARCGMHAVACTPWHARHAMHALPTPCRANACLAMSLCHAMPPPSRHRP